MPATQGLPAGARPPAAESDASRPWLESLCASDIGPASIAPEPAEPPTPPLPDPLAPAEPPPLDVVLVVEVDPVLVDDVVDVVPLPALPPPLVPVEPADPLSLQATAQATIGNKTRAIGILIAPSYHIND